MMKLNSVTAFIFIFALTSITSLITHNWVNAAAFAIMAAGFIISGNTGVTDFALSNQTGAPSLSAWRHDSAYLLVCTAITLFGFQIGQALYEAVNNLSR